MGLCPSKDAGALADASAKEQQQHAAQDNCAGEPTSTQPSPKPAMGGGAGTSSNSNSPHERPASTESGGLPAAAAGDGTTPRATPSPAPYSPPAAASGGRPAIISPTAAPQLDISSPNAASPSGGGPYIASPTYTSPEVSGGGGASSPPGVVAADGAASPPAAPQNGPLLNGSSTNAAAVSPPTTSQQDAATPFVQQQQSAAQPQTQQQQQQQPGPSSLPDVQQPPVRQWDRAGSVQAPSALASSASSGGRQPSQPGTRSVKFADPVPDSDDGSNRDENSNQQLPGTSSRAGGGGGGRRGLPRRSASSSALRSTPPAEVSEAVLAKQAEILRSNKAGKLRLRRGGLDSSFAAMQDALTQDAEPMEHVATRAAGLKHIGFGPFKRENQDEFFIQVGDFGGVSGGNLFCVFDGHGTHGKDAALYSRQLLPRLLDVEMRKYFMRVGHDSEAALRGAVEVLITEVFGDTERNLAKSGVNLASSGTTASVAFQRGNRLWVASAGDSRAILCTRNARDQWRALPLTIDHRPRRTSERERIEAAGARVAPKRLPSGRSVGEPRLWLQDAGGPGLLLSRSLGDLTAATVGCTSDPEVTFTTLRPHTDQVLVMATDGVWDVLTNEQVCDIVVESPDPHIACRRVLDAALYEWEERMSADNITVLVVEFEWNEDGASPVVVEHATATAFRPDAVALQPQPQQQAVDAALFQ